MLRRNKNGKKLCLAMNNTCSKLAASLTNFCKALN